MNTKSEAIRTLEALHGELTIGAYLRAIRMGDEETLEAFAARLGISRQHLSNIESGLKAVSPARAAEWADKLGYSPTVFIELALEDELRRAGLEYAVSVRTRGHAA